MANFRKYTLIPFKDENTEAAKHRVDAILEDKKLLPHEKLAFTEEMRGRVKDYEAQKAPPVVETRPSKDESESRKTEFSELRDLMKEMIVLLQGKHREDVPPPAAFTTTPPSSRQKRTSDLPLPAIPQKPSTQVNDADDEGDGSSPPPKKRNYFLEYLDELRAQKEKEKEEDKTRSSTPKGPSASRDRQETTLRPLTWNV